MRAWLLTAITAAAAGGFAGFAAAEDIALSLVHAKGRVDIPAGALEKVEARATRSFRNSETGAVHEYPEPYVEVCYGKEIQARICRLTQQIVGEPIAFVVDCETLMEPVVREPLCSQACFLIPTVDLAEATALMQRIRRGTNRACAPSS